MATRRHTSLHRGAALALALALAVGAGCFVDARAVGPVAQAALWTAAIVGTAVIIEVHDEHFHDDGCGHYRRWHEERWIYFYQERWEYYDPDSGTWYVYDG